MTSKGNEDDYRDLTECPICHEPFENPKGLPCIHTFCLECLEKYGKNKKKKHGDELECPTCQQKFKIPTGGFKDLPPNIFIRQIASRLRQLKDDRVQCNDCNKPNAKHWCVECKESMCNTCSNSHSNQRAPKTHKIVSLQEKGGSQVYIRACPTYCDAHEDEQLKFFCYDCSKAICVACSSGDHKKHTFTDLKISSSKFGDELKDCFPTLNESIESISKEQKLLGNRSSFMEEVSECERAIKEQSEEMKRRIDEQCDRLLDRLEEVKKERNKKAKIRQEEVDRQLLMMESFKTYVEELMEKGSACTISQSAKYVLSRARELQGSQVVFNKSRLSQERIWFEPAPMPDIANGPMGIGSIAISDNCVHMTSNSLIAVGLDNGSTMSQCVCHISLERQDSVTTLYSPNNWIGAGAAASVMRDSLYVVGTGIKRKDLWKWNFAKNWQRCEEENKTPGRFRQCAAVVDSMLYVLGGLTDSNATTLNSVISYRNQKYYQYYWYPVGQLMHAVSSAACISYKNLIYVFGGADANQKPVPHVQVYDTTKQKCTLQQKAMPRAYSDMRAVVCDTNAILLHCETCFIYNFETLKWLERETFKTGVQHFAFTIDKQNLYIAGGGRSKKDKDNKIIWECTDEVCRVSVRDVIENKPGAAWTHHATLPQSAMIHAFSPVPLSLASDK